MTGTTSIDQVKSSALRREAERLEEDTLYSSKGHFNAEDTWVRRNYWLGVPATILGAVAGATLIKSQPEWATAFTFLASLLTGLMTFLKPNERAALHRAAAGQLLSLRCQSASNIFHLSASNFFHFFRCLKRLRNVPGFQDIAVMGYDNTRIESFWGSLNNELVHHERYENCSIPEGCKAVQKLPVPRICILQWSTSYCA